MTPDEKAAWVEKTTRELEASFETIKANLLPIQEMAWEKEYKMRQDYQRISEDYDELHDELIDARLVLEKIASIRPTSDDSMIAVAMAAGFLDERGRNGEG